VNNVDPVKALEVRFPKGIGDVEERSERRAYVNVDSRMVREIADFLFNNLGARLIVITCLETRAGMELLYHFSFDGIGKIVSLRAVIRMPEPRIDAITPVIDGAEYFEREIMDLFGVEFVGHPNPTRFILGDGWPEGVYPYRKEHRGKYPYRTDDETADMREQILRKGIQ
jgi:Ni,Fe-hydrogenase III component G